MKNEGSRRDPRLFLNEVEARQRNVVWPDTVINGRAVDAFLWRGSPNATRVLRVGAWIFGLFFLAIGVTLFLIARQVSDRLFGLVAFVPFFLGVKLCRNGSLRHKKVDAKAGTLE